MAKKMCISTVLLLTLSLACKRGAVEFNQGTIRFLSGSVKVSSNGKSTAARIGDLVMQDMKITTEEASFAEIRFRETSVKILENSEVQVKELARELKNGAEKTEFAVIKGGIFSSVLFNPERGDSYRISSKTTVSAVQGSRFLVIEEVHRSVVACYDGIVFVKRSGDDDSGGIEIRSGQIVYVEEGKPLKAFSISGGGGYTEKYLSKYMEPSGRDEMTKEAEETVLEDRESRSHAFKEGDREGSPVEKSEDTKVISDGRNGGSFPVKDDSKTAEGGDMSPVGLKNKPKVDVPKVK